MTNEYNKYIHLEEFNLDGAKVKIEYNPHLELLRATQSRDNKTTSFYLNTPNPRGPAFDELAKKLGVYEVIEARKLKLKSPLINSHNHLREMTSREGMLLHKRQGGRE